MYLVASGTGEQKKSVDILGLQNEFEELYVDKVMPGISVLTKRFGYMSFICWTIEKGVDPRSERFRILEDALAMHEYKAKASRYTGIGNISRGVLPPYYSQSIFGDYRRTMIRLGLLGEDNQNTKIGSKVAGEFENKTRKRYHVLPKNLDDLAENGFEVTGRGKVKSLLELNLREKTIYRDLFVNGSRSSASKSMAKTRSKYKKAYESISKNKNPIFEADSSDRNTINALYQQGKNDKKFANMAIYLDLSYHGGWALFNLYKIVKENGPFEITAQNIHKHKKLEKCLHFIIAKHFQKWMGATKHGPILCKTLTSSNKIKILQNLVRQHCFAKSDRAWFVLKSKAVTLNPIDFPVPKSISYFGIRLNPFKSLMMDLK